MALDIFGGTSVLRNILDTETDADSPGSEELLSQVRENLESLLLLTYDAGPVGTITALTTAVNSTVGIATAAWSTDEHNGRSFVICSGDAKGNVYTIDDTLATAVILTGDNLYTDGVSTGDSFRILFNLKASSTGHDHDGINSKSVVLADNVITQAKLKSTTGEVSNATSATNLTLPGGEYGFFMQVKKSSSSLGMTAHSGHYAGAGLPLAAYTTQVYAGKTAGTGTAYIKQRYVQSSGEVHWIFLLKKKDTGKIVQTFESPDHPCFGNGGKPALRPHPFPGYDPTIHDIICITPTKEQVLEAQKACEQGEDKPDRGLIEVFLEDYEIDEKSIPEWPTDPVTVGLPPKWHESYLAQEPVTPIKKVIPKPDNILHKTIRRKEIIKDV